MSERQNTNGEVVPANGNGKRKPNRALRDKLYAETHNWRQSCLRAGYSESTANQGVRKYARMAPRTNIGVQEAVAQQLGASGLTPKALRDMSIEKLGTAIQTDKPLPTVREIELLGKFKEHDWYVRPENQMTTNVFTILADPQNAAMRDSCVSALDKYHTCDWCYTPFDEFNELIEHALTCTKKPITVTANTLIEGAK